MTHAPKKHHLWTLTLAAALGLQACGSNEDTASKKGGVPAETAPTAVEYTWNQKVFCLNMLSNISAHYQHKSHIVDSTKKAVKAVLENKNIQQYIGRWNLVWGPQVAYGKFTNVPANTMFIAQQEGTDNYVIAIAGTDPTSAIADVLEDANVDLTQKWAYGTDEHAKISQGTADGLDRLQKMNDIEGEARDFLGSLTKNGRNINVWVTGHSLGGFLSPTYALYLNDTKSQWIGKGNASISVLAAAGATPGNDTFATYYNTKLGATTIRVWNKLDVVPHAYEPDMVAEIPGLYKSSNPADTLPEKLFLMKTDALIKKLITIGTNRHYTQLTPGTIVGFTSDMYTVSKQAGYNGPDANTFTGQMMYQHIPAYPAFFGVDSFQYGVMYVIKTMTDPFFSDKAVRTGIQSYDTSGKNFNNMNPNPPSAL